MLLACLMLTAYFVVHAIQGRHGLEARSKLAERERTLIRELAGLEAIRRALTRDVSLLGDEERGLDRIDEAAREQLGFAHPADIVIRLSPEPSGGR